MHVCNRKFLSGNINFFGLTYQFRMCHSLWKLQEYKFSIQQNYLLLSFNVKQRKRKMLKFVSFSKFSWLHQSTRAPLFWIMNKSPSLPYCFIKGKTFHHISNYPVFSRTSYPTKFIKNFTKRTSLWDWTLLYLWKQKWQCCNVPALWSDTSFICDQMKTMIYKTWGVAYFLINSLCDFIWVKSKTSSFQRGRFSFDVGIWFNCVIINWNICKLQA